MKYVVRKYANWAVVLEHPGGYTTYTVAQHRWLWQARLRAWWLNRRLDCQRRSMS